MKEPFFKEPKGPPPQDLKEPDLKEFRTHVFDNDEGSKTVMDRAKETDTIFDTLHKRYEPEKKLEMGIQPEYKAPGQEFGEAGERHRQSQTKWKRPMPRGTLYREAALDEAKEKVAFEAHMAKSEASRTPGKLYAPAKDLIDKEKSLHEPAPTLQQRHSLKGRAKVALFQRKPQKSLEQISQEGKSQAEYQSTQRKEYGTTDKLRNIISGAKYKSTHLSSKKQEKYVPPTPLYSINIDASKKEKLPRNKEGTVLLTKEKAIDISSKVSGPFITKKGRRYMKQEHGRVTGQQDTITQAELEREEKEKPKHLSKVVFIEGNPYELSSYPRTPIIKAKRKQYTTTYREKQKMLKDLSK
jgi:hypothetical protein